MLDIRHIDTKGEFATDLWIKRKRMCGVEKIDKSMAFIVIR